MTGSEVERFVQTEGYQEARAAAAVLGLSQLHLAARAAGLVEWLYEAGEYKLDSISDNAEMELRMPFPSPFVSDIRSRAGFPRGVQTTKSGWSLDVSDNTDGSPLDTGVSLVSTHMTYDGEQLCVPLDIRVSKIFMALGGDRPDRFRLDIGERQLPHAELVLHENAQNLLVVTEKFLHLLASGEAATLVGESADLQASGAAPEAKKRGLKRLLPSKK